MTSWSPGAHRIRRTKRDDRAIWRNWNRCQPWGIWCRSCQRGRWHGRQRRFAGNRLWHRGRISGQRPRHSGRIARQRLRRIARERTRHSRRISGDRLLSSQRIGRDRPRHSGRTGGQRPRHGGRLDGERLWVGRRAAGERLRHRRWIGGRRLGHRRPITWEGLGHGRWISEELSRAGRLIGGRVRGYRWGDWPGRVTAGRCGVLGLACLALAGHRHGGVLKRDNWACGDSVRPGGWWLSCAGCGRSGGRVGSDCAVIHRPLECGMPCRCLWRGGR
jgi:hypothetical protein